MFTIEYAEGVVTDLKNIRTYFGTDDDWSDFQLENDPVFLKRIEDSRVSIRAGQGVSWEEIKREDDERNTKRSVPAW
uniref:Uncharacterized protein n=1 Tax=Candidatus Kentrum sp. FM TaxID=2126340 RepID=A0A450SXF6_9GAMM|nr:MAG: hypothetical protein BECKFM1743A_GA0114220_102248 [Candidatus Kentron sp. FM]VFJ60377.1 MAG: hypothetical protein BECKFM1743C_GA0114222_102719 [Candidatus Kentron sp. FM]VFK12793.1 MAG: hypothetical protein BECKFM1743B_GA0114221_102553 [Candidatus Kentron sp. FM]